MSQGPLPSSFEGDTEFSEESRWQKFSRRLKEEPLIPLGCALTCWAFFGASRSIRAGDSVRANVMFRRRLYAQGFTLVAMVTGSWYYKTDRTRRKEFEGLVAEKKAKEKNEAWIRELEARDKEEKDLKAKIESKKKVVMEKMDLGQVLTDENRGTGKKSGEGPVVKAVKELNSTVKESAEAVKEKVGATADTKDIKEDR